MSQASVVFMLVLIVATGVVGVIAVAFERRRVRESASPDRIPRRFRRQRGAHVQPRPEGEQQYASENPASADTNDARRSAYERTQDLPDGSRGGRFQED